MAMAKSKQMIGMYSLVYASMTTTTDIGSAESNDSDGDGSNLRTANGVSYDMRQGGRMCVRATVSVAFI